MSQSRVPLSHIESAKNSGHYLDARSTRREAFARWRGSSIVPDQCRPCSRAALPAACATCPHSIASIQIGKGSGPSPGEARIARGGAATICSPTCLGR